MRGRRPPPVDPAKRVMPHDLNAEMSVLGGVLLSNDTLSVLVDTEGEDFYDPKNRVVFTAMRNLEAAGRPVDIVTLESEITRAGKIEAVGGVGYLGELTLRVPTVDNVEEYARIVRQKRISRDVMVMLGQLIDEAYVGETEGEQLVHDVTTAMMQVRTAGEEPIVTIAELVAQEAERATRDAKERLAGRMVYAGVPTGIVKIDTMVGGAPVGIMTLVIGRPGNGKTTIALQFAHGATDAGMDSLVTSYEDGGQSFGQRGLAQESGIGTDLIRARRLNADDLITIAAAKVASAGRTETLLSASGMSVEALVRRVRRENIRRRGRGQKPYRQVIVDYLQAMPVPEWARSRDEGIGHISTTLKTMAVKEDMSVVLMCQLNREVEKRDDHRPRLSDIRDSGTVEQDGKFALGLYRPWIYGDKSTESDEIAKKNIKAEPTELHLIGLKNHQGEIDFDICLFWDVKSNAVYNSRLDYQQARAMREARLDKHRRRSA